MRSEDFEPDQEILVPIRAGDFDVYVAAVPIDADAFDAGTETEIADKQRSLQEALRSLSAIAQEASQSLKSTDASKVFLEFSCEFAVESSGALVAIVGKAGAKSGFKVSLEWTKQPNHP